MKAGMQTILTFKYSPNVDEYIALCGNDHEWATYVRFNNRENSDYYGHYFFDQKLAVADYLKRIAESE